MMANREIILNLWYVRDKEGVIYSLRVKAYVGEGSDQEKLELLRRRAMLDYLVAESFGIPQRFHVKIGSGPKPKVMPVAHVSMLKSSDSPIALFEDAIKSIEKRIPAQTQERISQDPLVCTTPLMQNKQGIIEPSFSGQIQY
jgi:hypothetical protein